MPRNLLGALALVGLGVGLGLMLAEGAPAPGRTQLAKSDAAEAFFPGDPPIPEPEPTATPLPGARTVLGSPDPASVAGPSRPERRLVEKLIRHMERGGSDVIPSEAFPEETTRAFAATIAAALRDQGDPTP